MIRRMYGVVTGAYVLVSLIVATLGGGLGVYAGITYLVVVASGFIICFTAVLIFDPVVSLAGLITSATLTGFVSLLVPLPIAGMGTCAILAYIVRTLSCLRENCMSLRANIATVAGLGGFLLVLANYFLL